MPYLTIQQAAEATGKSEKTIRRLVNKPESKQFITREEDKPNAPVQIDSNYLQSVYPMSGVNEPSQIRNSDHGQKVDTPSQPVQTQQSNDLQAEMLAMLKEQLRLKDEQIREKDQRIIDLTDKLTEIKLLTEAKPVEQPQPAPAPDPQPPQSEEQQPEPKKRRWWQF